MTGIKGLRDCQDVDSCGNGTGKPETANLKLQTATAQTLTV